MNLWITLNLRQTVIFSMSILLGAGIAWAQDGARPSLAAGELHDRETSAEPVHITRRWAFLVGVDGYNSLRELNYCVADMKVLKKALVQHGGYDPECVVMLTHEKNAKTSFGPGTFSLEMIKFLRKVGEDDSVLFAFSGHGDVDEDGKAWLMLPEVTFDPELKPSEIFSGTAFSVAKVYEMIEGSRARQKLVVLDACRSGATRGVERQRRVTLSDISPGKGILELLSCDEDQVSFESKELGQGVFSHFLAKGIAGIADDLANQDGLVTADELYNYAFKQTKGFVHEKHGKSQTPKRRSDAIGQIVVAKKTVENDLTDAHLLSNLTAREKAKELPSGFAENAKRWLGCDANFPPGIALRKLMSLLARKEINVNDFEHLAILPLQQVQNHLASTKKFESRKLFVVAVGINEYEHISIWPLPFKESDAKAFSEVTTRYGGDDTSTVLLLGENATQKRVQDEIRKANESAQKGDLVAVYFAGIGMGGFNDDDKVQPPAPILDAPNERMKQAKIRLRERLMKDYWFMSDSKEGSSGNYSNVLTALFLMDQMKESKADMFVFSDAVGFDFPMPNLSRISEDQGSWKSIWKDNQKFNLSSVDRSRSIVFCSRKVEFTPGASLWTDPWSLGMPLFTSLSGWADSGVTSSYLAPFLPLISKRNEHGKIEIPNSEDIPPVLSAPDGFVSVQEVVALLQHFNSLGSDCSLRGQLAPEECLFTRVHLDRD